MAEETTPRLGLDKYTSGTDLHPNREKFNASREILEKMTAIAMQGIHAARPAAGKGGQLYCSTDQNNRVYFDNGTQWVEVAPVGGVTPGAVAVGGTASEGTSNRAARIDHTHNLPLANSTAHGAMSKEDKAKLDAATSANTGGTVVMRALNGRVNLTSISVGTTPVTADDAVRKDYLDSSVNNTKAYTDQQVATRSAAGHGHTFIENGPGRLGLYSGGGFYYQVNGATKIGSTLDGQIFSSTPPSLGNHLANKSYVDGQVGTRAAANHNHSGANITTGLISPDRIANATNTRDGLMSKADKAMLDTKTSYGNSNSLMMRNSYGDATLNQLTLSAAAPTSANHAARKDYVDKKTWDGSDIVSGLINQARIANATSTLNGLMSATDKEMLNAATGSNVGYGIVRRYGDGTFTTQQVSLAGAPTATSHATRKDYVDNAVNQFKPGAWVNANLRAGWEAHPAYSTPQYRIVNDTVELRGVARPTTGVAGDIIFSVTSAYIPSADRALASLIGVQTVARAFMTTRSGTFYVPAGVTGLNYVSLDGLSYNL